MAVILLLIIAAVGSIFISRKEGYHMDELLSFELANAEFTPWIVTTQPQGRLEKYVVNELRGETALETLSNLGETLLDVLQNRGNSKLLSYEADVYEEPVWLTGDDFTAYLTTDGQDSFNYLSVYFNVKDDNHPPLHFMLLHTMSSIFRGQIHPWMGCVINLVLILLICLLLWKIALRMTGQRSVGIAAMLLYGLSIAGLQTLLLIRMYALLTFFCVLVFYLHLTSLDRQQYFEKHNKALIAAVVCGFLTQYFFLFYMAMLALCTVLWLWKKVSGRAALAYIRTMVLSALWGLILYPFAIDDVLHSGRGVEAVQNLGSGIGDLTERLSAFGSIVLREVLGGKTVLLCMIVEVCVWWLISKLRHVKETEVVSISFLLFLIVPVIFDFLLTIKAAPYYEDRYIMPLFPFFSLLIVYGLYVIGAQLSVPRLLPILGALCLIVSGLMQYRPAYLYTGYAGQLEVADAYADRDCLCVYDGVGYYENLVEFTKYDQTLMVTETELTERSKDPVLIGSEELVVLLKSGIDPQTVADVLASYGLEQKEVLLESGVHGDTLYLFAKAP